MGNLKFQTGSMNTTPAYHFHSREQAVVFQRINIQSKSGSSYLLGSFYYIIKSDLFSFLFKVYSHISISRL